MESVPARHNLRLAIRHEEVEVGTRNWGGSTRNDDARCRGCGQKRPSDAPGGLCPACLLRAGLDGAGSGPPEVTVTVRPGAAMRWRGWRTAWGDCREVLLRDTDPGPTPGRWPARPRPRCPPPPTAPPAATALGEIARGGMGAVLKGRDPDLGRDLAVKVLLESHRDKPDLIRRFVEEAQIGGQLQHPGIVPIYELGAFADRRPYFAMKLVKGRTLSEPARRAARPGARPAALPLDLRGRLPDDGLRPRPRRDPPRPEAVEHHGRLVRRGPGDGLGPGQGLAPGRRGRRRLGRQDAGPTTRSSPRPAAARTRTPTSRRPAA